jgi:bifunctional UDP-N-acetylglucosamine pyrophosphorylase/glucosamine-1-phosphate N-acetyltransferase
MTQDLAVVILAAGRSTRFKSAKTKVLHPLAGRPLLEWVLNTAAELEPTLGVIVHGAHNGDELRQYFGDRLGAMPLSYALQDPPHGTGHALLQAEAALPPGISQLFVLTGDAPLLESADLRSLQAARDETGAEHAVLTAVLADPSGYGRIVRDMIDPHLANRIIEHHEAGADVREIREVNSGMYLFSRSVFDQLRAAAAELGASETKGEYYLPDTVRYGRTAAVRVEDPFHIEGINDRAQLARLESHVQAGLRERWQAAGVTFVLPESVYLHVDITLDQDVTVGPQCVLTNGTRIGSGTELSAGCLLDGCTIGSDCRLLHVRGLDAVLEAGVTVGPYVNLRPGTVLRQGVKVGNFVETKKADVGPGSKLPHLSYVGDAAIGSDCNIGAGTIFCNYDGVNKSQTVLGNGVFIGSNSSLQAPLSIGDGAYIGMASAITQDVPADALAVGRARQENKPGYAKRLRERQARLKTTSEELDPANGGSK